MLAPKHTSRAAVLLITSDKDLARSVETAFGSSEHVDLAIVSDPLPAGLGALPHASATVAVIDVNLQEPEELLALERVMAGAADCPPVVVLTDHFDQTLARRLMQMHVADCLQKPISPAELARACARAARSPKPAVGEEAQIFAFLPAVGGAGVTTLAVQTAMILLGSAKKAKAATCLVDLDFQHGACADYLDIEPRLNLGEIEPRPERLDRQLLEVMLSYHSSGLAVIAAPNSPAEMRSFDPTVVTRLLDLVSANFDYVVFDMPRTWFSWTDNVLLGSNKLFVVGQPTVPGLRQTKQLVTAIRDRLDDAVKPRVIINRFVQKMFAAGLRYSDVEKAIGEPLLSCIPNDYALVREAIDRGVTLEEVKPGNKITMQLKKMILPEEPREQSRIPFFGRKPTEPKQAGRKQTERNAGVALAPRQVT
jgi:pilus assembly protein CpaE